MTLRYVLVVALLAWVLPSAAKAQQSACALASASPAPNQRLALIIAAADYDASGRVAEDSRAVGSGYLSDLANPLNDAREMTTKLCRLDFHVATVTDPTRGEVERAIAEFSVRAAQSPDSVTLIYFSGHALQVNGQNWLLPVGAQLPPGETMRSLSEAQRAERLAQLAVPLQALFDQLPQPENAGEGATIVIVDACRNNPWQERLSATGARTLLAAQPPPGDVGSMIVYSTAAGARAADGVPGANSPFTTSLLAHMDEPGLELSDILRKVRRDVFQSEGQAPWELGSLLEPFCFTRCNAVPATASVGGRECAIDQSDGYFVFFEWDSTAITPEAQAVIEAALVNYGESGAECATIIYPNITGGESDTEAQQARVATVVRFLTQRGVRRDSILRREILGIAERDPMARRIEIRFASLTPV